MTFSFDDPLLKLAAVLFAGIVGGELTGRLKLPKVTGWIGTGIILTLIAEKPGLMPWLDQKSVAMFKPYMNFVLGYIAFTVGAALHFASLKNAARRLTLLLLGEALVTPSIVIAALTMIGGMNMRTALIMGAIAICGAPGTTVLVVQEARSRGIMTRTLVAAVALIDMVAVGVFAFAVAFLPADANASLDLASWPTALGAVGQELGLAFIVGFGVAAVALLLNRFVVGPAFVGPLMVGVILASWGAAVGAGVSGILACTFAGIVVSNWQHDTVRSTEAYLHGIGGVLFAGFYTLAGMKLDFSQVLVPATAALVFLFFAARFLGKYVGAFSAMALARVPARVRNYLGVALLPHGGVAVGLILLVEQTLPDIAPTVTTVGLAALAINQLLGPSATRLSLFRSGEAEKDRARLLDFLDEQHIAVDLGVGDKESLVKTLASRLYAVTPSMPIKQDEFVERVMAREAEETTCLGEGLMIPHAILKTGGEVTGVLGISREGLPLETPDGMPIHAVLLLATPETDRRRHLEVLAAFATAITRDINLREQLYHARTAAHAYDVLHAEEAEDINYFLEEAFERVGVRED